MVGGLGTRRFIEGAVSERSISCGRSDRPELTPGRVYLFGGELPVAVAWGG
jgi:hypothetical protein